MKLAHVINPVSVAPESDLFLAQPITFESMRKARDLAGTGIEVELLSATYAEDRRVSPQGFAETAPLHRSILDFGDFRKKRKLPLIQDIVQLMKEAVPDAQLYIYTNVDIAVMPGFYRTIAKLHQRGTDAMVINRRTLDAGLARESDLDFLYMQAGRKHPGFDCFAFSREIMPKIDLGELCIGVPCIGHMFALNLAVHARTFEMLDEAHLTFHLGDDQTWRDPSQNDLLAHNQGQVQAILSRMATAKWLDAPNTSVKSLLDSPVCGRWMLGRRIRAWLARIFAGLARRIRP